MMRTNQWVSKYISFQICPQPTWFWVQFFFFFFKKKTAEYPTPQNPSPIRATRGLADSQFTMRVADPDFLIRSLRGRVVENM
jgi:hypothetical protein